MRVLWVWFCCVGLASAQTFPDLFRQAADTEAKAGQDSDVVRAAWRRAFTAFEALAAAEQATAAADGARAALGAGEPNRALQIATEAGDIAGTDPGFLVLRLRAAIEAASPDAFVTALGLPAARDAVGPATAALARTHGGALCEAADRALRAGHAEAGLGVFEALATVSGRHPVALANWALGLRMVGREVESEALYREALEQSPSDPDLWNDYGLLLKGLHRDREAAIAFARSHALDPTTPPTGPAVSNLAFLHAAARGQEVAEARLHDPIAALAAVVARRPDAQMARRLLLDAMAAPARFQGVQPDRGSAGR